MSRNLVVVKKSLESWKWCEGDMCVHILDVNYFSDVFTHSRTDAEAMKKLHQDMLVFGWTSTFNG